MCIWLQPMRTPVWKEIHVPLSKLVALTVISYTRDRSAAGLTSGGCYAQCATTSSRLEKFGHICDGHYRKWTWKYHNSWICLTWMNGRYRIRPIRSLQNAINIMISRGWHCYVLFSIIINTRLYVSVILGIASVWARVVDVPRSHSKSWRIEASVYIAGTCRSIVRDIPG
jgi:hypothetical protein